MSKTNLNLSGGTVPGPNVTDTAIKVGLSVMTPITPQIVTKERGMIAGD